MPSATTADSRLSIAPRNAIAAANGFGHVRIDPEKDQITSKLPALHLYQLAIAAPRRAISASLCT